MTAQFTSTDIGWTCANCGMWVPPNQPHECPTAKTINTAGDVGYIYMKSQEAILLEKILAILERIDRKYIIGGDR